MPEQPYATPPTAKQKNGQGGFSHHWGDAVPKKADALEGPKKGTAKAPAPKSNKSRLSSDSEIIETTPESGQRRYS